MLAAISLQSFFEGVSACNCLLFFSSRRCCSTKSTEENHLVWNHSKLHIDGFLATPCMKQVSKDLVEIMTIGLSARDKKNHHYSIVSGMSLQSSPNCAEDI